MVFADDHALYVEITGDGGLRMRRINTGDGDRKRPTPGSTCLISYSVVPPEEQGAGGRVDKHVHESLVLGHPDVPLAIDIALQHMMQAKTHHVITFSQRAFSSSCSNQGDEYDLLVSDAYMRETIIRPASDCAGSAGSAADSSAAPAAETPMHADAAPPNPPSNAPASTETAEASTCAVTPSFDTHARHTRIRIFLHSFKGAVL
jgi:hypothetical protein